MSFSSDFFTKFFSRSLTNFTVFVRSLNEFCVFSRPLDETYRILAICIQNFSFFHDLFTKFEFFGICQNLLSRFFNKISCFFHDLQTTFFMFSRLLTKFNNFRKRQMKLAYFRDTWPKCVFSRSFDKFLNYVFCRFLAFF